MSPNLTAPAQSPAVLHDQALDAAVAFRYLDAEAKGGPRRRPLKAQDLRTLIALISCAYETDEHGDVQPVSPFEPYTVREEQLLERLSPRKSSSSLGAFKPQALRKTLDSLERLGVVELLPLSNRAGRIAEDARYRRIMRVVVTLEPVAPEPRFEHARRIALDAVEVTKLDPSKVALLTNLAYAAFGEGDCRPMEPEDVEETCGLSMRTVLTHLREETLGREHGLAYWSWERGDRGAQFFARFCQPNAAEVELARPRLHASFITDMRAAAAEPAMPAAAAPQAQETPRPADPLTLPIQFAQDEELLAPRAQEQPEPTEPQKLFFEDAIDAELAAITAAHDEPEAHILGYDETGAPVVVDADVDYAPWEDDVPERQADDVAVAADEPAPVEPLNDFKALTTLAPVVEDTPGPIPTFTPAARVDGAEVFRLRNVALSFVQDMAEARVYGDDAAYDMNEQMLWDECGEALEMLHAAGHMEPRAYIAERLAEAINDVRVMAGVAA